MPRKRKGFRLSVITHSSKHPRGRKQTVKLSDDQPMQSVTWCRQQCSGGGGNDVPCVTGAEDVDKKPYSDKVTELAEEWAAIRDKLFFVARQTEAPVSFTCIMCLEAVQSPIRCKDCNPLYVFCETCERNSHRRMLHKPEVWGVSKIYV